MLKCTLKVGHKTPRGALQVSCLVCIWKGSHAFIHAVYRVSLFPVEQPNVEARLILSAKTIRLPLTFTKFAV